VVTQQLEGAFDESIISLALQLQTCETARSSCSGSAWSDWVAADAAHACVTATASQGIIDKAFLDLEAMADLYFTCSCADVLSSMPYIAHTI
jgi:hypothetical protein